MTSDYKIGRDIIQTFLDYYKVVGVLEANFKKDKKEKKVFGGKVRKGALAMGSNLKKRILEKRNSITPGKVMLLQLSLGPTITPILPRKKLKKFKKDLTSYHLPTPRPKTPSLSIIDFNNMARGGIDNALIDVLKH